MSDPTRKPGDPPPDEWDVELDAWDAQFGNYVKDADPNAAPATAPNPASSTGDPASGLPAIAPAAAALDASESPSLQGASLPLSADEIALELEAPDRSVDVEEVTEFPDLAGELEPPDEEVALPPAVPPVAAAPSVAGEVRSAEVAAAFDGIEGVKMQAAIAIASPGNDLLGFDDDPWQDLQPPSLPQGFEGSPEPSNASSFSDDSPLAELSIDWDDGEEAPRSEDPPMPAFLSPHELVLPDDLAGLHDDLDLDLPDDADFAADFEEEPARAVHVAPPPVIATAERDRPPTAESTLAASARAASSVGAEVSAPVPISVAGAEPLGPPETAQALPALELAAARRLFIARREGPDEAPTPARIGRRFGALRLAVSDRTPSKVEYADALRTSDGLIALEAHAREAGVVRAGLTCARARIAERRGELALARTHYKNALTDDATCLPALRGERRLALASGDIAIARDSLARELSTEIGEAKGGLLAVDAELALASGAAARAEESYRALLVENPTSLVGRTGRVDAAFASGGDWAERVGELAELISEGELRAALHLAKARGLEAKGPAARPDFRAAVGKGPASAAGALGLLRVAMFERDAAGEADALARLEPLVDEALGAAVARRRAALRLRAGDAVGALALLPEPTGPTRTRDHACDALRLTALRARRAIAVEKSSVVEPLPSQISDEAPHPFRTVETPAAQAGEEARRALELALLSTVAQAHVDDQGGLWCELGELAEEGGRGADAVACYRSAAALWPDDPRPRAAITRLLGPTGAELAASDPIRALSEEVDPGTRIEALLGDDRSTDAARLLAQEAERRRGLGETVAADLLGERAVRLLSSAGLLVEATAALRRLSPAVVEAGARRTILREWLRKRSSLAAAEQAAGVEALVGEARQAADDRSSASLWYRVGEAAEVKARPAAVAAYNRALELDDSFAPAEVALHQLGERAALAELHRRRRAVPEALGAAARVAMLLRPALALDEEDEVVISACRTALAEVPRGAAIVVEERLLDRLRNHGDRLGALALLAARGGQGSESDEIVLALALAEAHGSLGDHHAAVVELRRVAPLGHGAISARLALVRSLSDAGLPTIAADLVSEVGNDEAAQRLILAEQKVALAERGVDGRSLPAIAAHLLDLDPASQRALRAIERHLLRHGTAAERFAHYPRILAVLRDPPLTAVLAVECARLAVHIGEAQSSDAPLRAALHAEPNCRPALRLLLARAEAANDPNALVPICERLAEEPDFSAVSAAVMLARAGQAWARLGRTDEAVVRYRAAIARGHGQLPHLLALLELAVAQDDVEAAVEAAEAAGGCLRDRDERVRAYLVAGALAHQALRDPQRAVAAFRAVRSLDPHHPEAFDHLSAQLRADRDAVGEVSLLTDYARYETDPRRAFALHLRLARLLRDELGDPGLAKSELQDALALDPHSLEALAELTALHVADKEWPDAADILIRRARLERDRSRLREIFRQLGALYSGPLPDTRRAIGSHARVLEFDPDDSASLEAIADLYERDEDFQNALNAIARLTQKEPDPERRIELLLRASRLQERGLANPRAAAETLRRILVEEPLHLAAIERLNALYEAQGDVTSARVHLNRVIQVARTAIQNAPRRAELYHKLFQLFEWRHSTDQALMLAQLLDAMGIADAKERQVMASQNATRYPGAALAGEGVDERLFSPGLPAGFRHLFGLLEEPLYKLYRSDIKRLGLKRSERLPRSGHPVRDIANQIAAELRLPEIEIYVAQNSTQLLLEPSDPVTLVIGGNLLPSDSSAAPRSREGELRFLLTRQLKMMQSRLLIPLRLSSEELGLLLAGLVRQFVPDFAPPQLPETQVAAEAARLAKAIPRKTLHDAMPFALECAAPGMDLTGFWKLVQRGADRAGLVGAGGVKPALAVLGRLGDPGALEDLARFVISDELFELRQALGLAIAAMG